MKYKLTEYHHYLVFVFCQRQPGVAAAVWSVGTTDVNMTAAALTAAAI